MSKEGEAKKGVTITGTHALIFGMLVLTVISMGSAVYTNTYGNSAFTAEQIVLMIENNPPQDHDHDLEEHEHMSTEIGSHNHAEYALKSHGHIEYAPQVHNHGTTTTGGSNDFDLYTSLDQRGSNTENRFKEGEKVYIHGYNDSNDRNIDWEIRDPNNVEIYSRNTGTSAFDAFFLQYDIPDNMQRGIYTVIVELDRDIDEITFFVE